MRTILGFVVLLSVFGCAHYHYPFSMDELKAQGYTCVASGNAFSMWQKEIRDEGRRLHLCVEPGRTTVGYVFDSSVLVDGKEAWSYVMGGGSSQPPLLHGISCVTTDPIPEGNAEWRAIYRHLD
jgi:hypothetical protein